MISFSHFHYNREPSYFFVTNVLYPYKHIKFMKVNEDGSVHFILEMPVAEQVCPHCGASTRKSKGKRPRDVKFGATQHHTVTATYLQNVTNARNVITLS